MENKMGVNVKMFREKMNFDQSVITRFLGENQNKISMIEQGRETLSSDKLEKLACLFGVSVNDIENGNVEKMKLPQTFKMNDLSIEELEAISAINRIVLNLEEMDNIDRNIKLN